MTAAVDLPTPAQLEFDGPWAVLAGIALTHVAVDHVGGLSGVLSGLNVYVTNLFDRALSDPSGADVRWVEGYNEWCARWAAAQSQQGPPKA